MLKLIIFLTQSMRHLFILILSMLAGVFCPAVTFAQDDEEKKKPSWSTGLPERHKTPSMNTPDAKVEKPLFEMDQPASIDIPESDMAFPEGLDQKFEMPEITINQSAPKEPKQEEPKKEEPKKEEPKKEYAVYSDNDPFVLDQYQWETIEMEPVKIPKTLYFSHKEVLLEVTINPEGQVLKVARVSDRTPNSILSYANRAIKKWRFKAPSEHGIDGNITDIIRVELFSR